MVFINLSNHPSEKWSEEQLSAARKYGDIIDIPFPAIDAMCTEDDIDDYVKKYYVMVKQYDNPVVMIQGEFTFTYRMVNCLKENGIKTLASCTDRIVEDKVLADGRIEKTSLFQFARFREY